MWLHHNLVDVADYIAWMHHVLVDSPNLTQVMGLYHLGGATLKNLINFLVDALSLTYTNISTVRNLQLHEPVSAP